MLPSMPASSLWAALLVSSATAQSYKLADEYAAKNWFDKFDFFTVRHTHTHIDKEYD